MKTSISTAGSTTTVPAVLEALLLAAAQATAPAHASSPPLAKASPPSAELLEFLADWSEEEAGLIDELASPIAAKPPEGTTKP